MQLAAVADVLLSCILRMKVIMKRDIQKNRRARRRWNNFFYILMDECDDFEKNATVCARVGCHLSRKITTIMKIKQNVRKAV